MLGLMQGVDKWHVGRVDKEDKPGCWFTAKSLKELESAYRAASDDLKALMDVTINDTPIKFYAACGMNYDWVRPSNLFGGHHTDPDPHKATPDLSTDNICRSCWRILSEEDKGILTLYMISKDNSSYNVLFPY
jgi:hypothetical protein